MSNEASRLLRESESESDEIECVECGQVCPLDADLCPHCGQIPKLILLSELGKQLPIGLLETVEEANGQKEVLKKEFDVIATDWNIERDVDKTWKKIKQQPGITILDYLVCVLAHTVIKLAGVNFRKHNPDRRLAVLNNMFAGDIFYMYTYVRIESMGNTFPIEKMECARCKHVHDFPVDLYSLEVATRKDAAGLYKTIQLRDGFESMGEQRHEITIRPATFFALAHIPDTNEAEMFAALTKDSVVAIEGMPEGATMTDSDIHQLSKWDMSMINEEIDLVAGGPQWIIEGECPKCNFGFDHEIDWRYSNFFSRSSRSRVRRRRSRR